MFDIHQIMRMYAREAVEAEQARAARVNNQGLRLHAPPPPGKLENTIKLLTDITKVSNAAIPLAGDLTTLGLKVSWKATKLFGKMTLGIMALWGVGKLGTNSIFAAEAAIKAANKGVILLGVAGIGFLAYQGTLWVKDNIEEVAATAAGKAKLYLAPKPPKQKAFKPRPKFPDLNPTPAKPQGVQVIDPRELMMMQQLFGGANGS